MTSATFCGLTVGLVAATAPNPLATTGPLVPPVPVPVPPATPPLKPSPVPRPRPFAERTGPNDPLESPKPEADTAWAFPGRATPRLVSPNPVASTFRGATSSGLLVGVAKVFVTTGALGIAITGPGLGSKSTDVLVVDTAAAGLGIAATRTSGARGAGVDFGAGGAGATTFSMAGSGTGRTGLGRVIGLGSFK